MTELKTLKDIPSSPNEDDYTDHSSYYRDISLRQAAIKWIKEFQSERTKAISEMFDNVDKSGIYPTTNFFNRIDNFWMEKFNITNEEIEDK